MGFLKPLLSLIISILALAPASLSAGHLYGGGITWECDGSGDHIFYLTIYRDCDMGASPSSAQLEVMDHPNINSIPLSLDTSYDISPDCQSVPGGPSEIQCSGGGGGAIEKVVLASAPVSLGGSPPPDGWTFYWTAQTRSTGPTNLVSPGTKGITLRSKMYPRPSGVSPCQDASPRFSDPPVTILCQSLELRWSPGVIDPDSDSLSFDWAQALGETNGANFDPPSDPVPMTYQTGFSFDEPFPGILSGTGGSDQQLDPTDGDLLLQNPSQGDFNYVLKISSWKGGQKVAEVFRESGVVITGCPNGTTAPEILPPFSGGAFQDTFQVGQNLNIPLKAVDEGALQDGSAQSVSLSLKSEAFGQNQSNAGSGCPDPPCATLSPSSPNSSTDTVTSTFQWTLDCSHLSTSSPEGAGRFRRYEFLIEAKDDHCSVPGRSRRKMSIFVENRGPAPPPALNCVDRQGGDVRLSWTPLGAAYPSFNGYVIHRASNEGGPFAAIDTVAGIGSDSFIDPGAASGSDRYYFIRSLSGCDGKLMSQPSDTLQRLDLSVNDPNNGKALLDWNEFAVSDTAPHSGTGSYRIYKEYPMGTWQLIDSVPYGTTQYDDTIMVCSDSINYRIEIEDEQRNCLSTSNVDGGTFSDVLAPSVPEIAKVSVDTSIGKSTIDWDPVPQPDTKGYLVLQIIGGTEYVIDTVWGRTNTFYSYGGSNAPITSENFAIAAFDSCYSGSPPRPNTSTRGDIHNSMNLTGEKQVCQRRTKLSWNPYRNWESGVDEYRVFYLQNGSSPIYVGKTDPGDTSMTHGKVPVNEEYCYVVQAVANDGTKALSDKECFTMDFPEPPDFHYLSTATVLPENKGIEVRSIADTNSGQYYFRLERAKGSGSYEEVKTVPGNGTYVQSITDISVDPTKGSYDHRIIVEDSCGNEILTSNLGKTVHLNANATREPPVNVLHWTNYGDWDGQVSGYEIHRMDRKKGIDKTLDVVDPMRRSYEHRVGQGVQNESGRYCYYVLARESGNSYGRNEVARSNEACAFQKPYIHIPNAYVVNGASESFNAVTGHVQEEGYHLRIFDRWGHKIFETKDPEEGWKGRDRKGDLVPEGVYVYHFTFRTSDGQRVDRRGGVTLLHR